MATSGQLSLHILEARLTRDTQTFGKQDPYCLIETRMQRFRTQTMTDAGMDPAWPNECMNIDVKYVGDDLNLAVMNENMTSDDSIGEATIKLSSLCIGTGLDEWFEIQYKGKAAGHIHLKSEWSPKSEELKDLPKPEEAQRPALVYSNGVVAPPVNYIPPPVMMQAPQYYQQHHPQQYAYTQQYPQYQMMQPMQMQQAHYAQVVPLQQVQVVPQPPVQVVPQPPVQVVPQPPVQVVPQPQVQITQQTVVIKQAGNKCCVDPDCQQYPEYTCTVNYCCKDRGCGGRMCALHKGKKCQQKSTKHGPPVNVCINCEPYASKWNYIQNAPALIVICCCICCCLGMLGGGGGGSSSSSTSYYDSYYDAKY